MNSANDHRPSQEWDTAHGVDVTWHDDNRILVVIITDTSAPALQGWQHIIDHTAREWPSDQPMLVVHEITANLDWFPNRIRRDAAELVKEFNTRYPNLTGRVAVVIPPTVRARFMRVFIETLVYDGPELFEFEIFNNRDAALRWTRELL
jgi:hypothetical protein